MHLLLLLAAALFLAALVYGIYVFVTSWKAILAAKTRPDLDDPHNLFKFQPAQQAIAFEKKIEEVGDLESAEESKIMELKDLLFERALGDLRHIREAHGHHRTSTTLYQMRKIGDVCWFQAEKAKKAADKEFEMVVYHSKTLEWSPSDAVTFFTGRARKLLEIEKRTTIPEKDKRMLKAKGLRFLKMGQVLQQMISKWQGPPLNIFRMAAQVEAFEMQARQQQHRLMHQQQQQRLLQQKQQEIDKQAKERQTKQKQYDQIKQKMKELEEAKSRAKANGPSQVPGDKFTGLKKGFLRRRRNATKKSRS